MTAKKKLKSGYRWNSNLEHYKTEFFQGHSFPRKLPWRFCQGLPPSILQSEAHNWILFSLSRDQRKCPKQSLSFHQYHFWPGMHIYIQGSCLEGKGKTAFSKNVNLQQIKVSVCVCVCVCELNRVQLFVTPWTIAHHAPLYILFSRQEYWSGLPFSVLLQGIFLTQRRWDLHLLRLWIGRQVRYHCATWGTQ